MIVSFLNFNFTSNIASISSRCSGKRARTHPPKERLDACYFLCWFKPILLPPADFIFVCKDCHRNYHIKTESPALIHHMARRFRQRGDTGRTSRVRRNTRFVRLFVVNFSFNDCGWRDLASSRIFSRRFRSR